MGMAAFIHGVVLVGAYAVLWFLCLFCLLPVGLGAARDPESGAPLSPMLGKKALWATAIATVLWLIFYAAIRMGFMAL
jgi:predicted secreted protein